MSNSESGNNKKLRVVCAGTGYFSQFHYDAWKRCSDDVDLVGVYNRSLENAQAFADKFEIPNSSDNLADLLEKLKPDLLDIITPPPTHVAFVELAARHGVDVICQKPFGETLADAQSIVEIAEKANINVIVHENFRFMPWYRAIKSLLEQGSLGTVYNATFRLRPGDGQGPEAYLARQPYFQTMPRFLIHETAIHLVDTFRFLFGEVHSVFADLRRCNPAIKGEDAGFVVFDFDHDLRAVFDGNRLLDHPSTNTRRTMGEMLIEGEAGSLRLDGEGRIWLRQFGKQNETQHPYSWNDASFGGDCVFHLIHHVIEHYRHQTALENTGREYLTNIAIENAIYTSNSEKRSITLSESDV